MTHILLQAVLCRYKEDQKSCVGIPLSTAHNPSLYEERMRIQKAGGHVKYDWDTFFTPFETCVKF